ncbi:MAG: hypothetical protein QME59_03940 [Candidatus Hydrothermarchaeota archaeon]|nr:hypothetical protein [Candidatus Hydrothermarchaeota archaeon]
MWIFYSYRTSHNGAYLTPLTLSGKRTSFRRVTLSEIVDVGVIKPKKEVKKWRESILLFEI